MPLTKQTADGTTVANTYADVAEVTAYCSIRALAVPTNIDALLILAMDYLELLEYKSTPVNDEQSTAFPRAGFGIPSGLIKAQVILALEAKEKPLMPTVDAGCGNVKMERVEGAVTVQYDTEAQQSASEHKFPEVDLLLKPYLAENMSGMAYGNVAVSRI